MFSTFSFVLYGLDSALTRYALSAKMLCSVKSLTYTASRCWLVRRLNVCYELNGKIYMAAILWHNGAQVALLFKLPNEITVPSGLSAFTVSWVIVDLLTKSSSQTSGSHIPSPWWNRKGLLQNCNMLWAFDATKGIRALYHWELLRMLQRESLSVLVSLC